MCYASAAATGSLYGTTAERVSTAESINASSALVALYGPILDVHSLGELAMTKTTVTYAVLVMALCLVLVRRHTRVEEESGRAELLGALGVEPSAPLLSAVLVGDRRRGARRRRRRCRRHRRRTAGRRVALVRGLLARPRAGRHRDRRGRGPAVRRAHAPAARSLPGPSPCCSSLRAIGDTTASWLSWLSPFGWSTQLRAWSDPRGWVLLLDLALAGGLVGRRRRPAGPPRPRVRAARRASRPGHRVAAPGRRAGPQPPGAHARPWWSGPWRAPCSAV